MGANLLEAAKCLADALKDEIKEGKFSIVDRMALASNKESGLIAIYELERTLASGRKEVNCKEAEKLISEIIKELTQGDEKKGLVKLWSLASLILSRAVLTN